MPVKKAPMKKAAPARKAGGKGGYPSPPKPKPYSKSGKKAINEFAAPRKKTSDDFVKFAKEQGKKNPSAATSISAAKWRSVKEAGDRRSLRKTPTLAANSRTSNDLDMVRRAYGLKASAARKNRSGSKAKKK